MIGGEGQGRKMAHRQHRRDAGIEKVGVAHLRVAEHLAEPHQARQQRLAGPAARPLDQPEIALDAEPGLEVRGRELGIARPPRHQQGHGVAAPRKRGDGIERLLAAGLSVEPGPHQRIEDLHALSPERTPENRPWIRCGQQGEWAMLSQRERRLGEQDGDSTAVAAEEGEAETVRGRDFFGRAFLLASGGWIGCVLLQVLLYARPAPHGGPFLAEWSRYFGLAVYYDLLGVWLVSFPFFLLWLGLFNRPLPGRGWRAVAMLQAGLLILYLALSQVDHELLRFLGVRLNPSFLFAYGQPQMLSDALFLELLGADRGGAYLPLILLVLVPSLYGWWAIRLLRRRGGGGRRVPALGFAILLALVPLAAPANGWRMATSQFRLRKVEPVIIAFATDVAAGYEDRRAPDDLDRLVADYRQAWLARSTDPGWRFPDPDLPYLRVPVGPAPGPPGERWNVIYLQLETLRGADTGFLRADLARSPTPFLDRLAQRPDAAAWTRDAELRDAEHQRHLRDPLLDHAAVAALHHRAHPRTLSLPARNASGARVPHRDVQRRRYRLGQ